MGECRSSDLCMERLGGMRLEPDPYVHTENYLQV